MIVIKDCTGQYLRFENKDYPICNEEIVSTISSGTVVNATFRKSISKCKAQDQIRCAMVHPHEVGDYWIQITKIS